MIGEQHQRAADQILRRICCPAPRRRRSAVQRVRPTAGLFDHGRRRPAAGCARRLGAAFGRAVVGARIGFGRQRQHGDGAIDRAATCAVAFRDRSHRGPKHAGKFSGGKRIGRGRIPQQASRPVRRSRSPQASIAVDAAIDRAVFGDGRDRRNPSPASRRRISQAPRFRPTARGGSSGRARPRPGSDGARVGDGLRADQAAADIGVEGGRRDGELGRGLAGGKIERLADFFILIS